MAVIPTFLLPAARYAFSERSWNRTLLAWKPHGKRAWPSPSVRVGARGRRCHGNHLPPLRHDRSRLRSEPCEECRDDEAHTLDRALLQTPFPFYDVNVIPRSEDADDDLLHLAFFGNEVFYAMHLDDEDARVLLATLRKAVDLLTERLGPSTAELPAFPGEAHRRQKNRRRRPPP